MISPNVAKSFITKIWMIMELTALLSFLFSVPASANGNDHTKDSLKKKSYLAKPKPIELKGRVMNKAGNAIVGASVIIAGTTNGTTTNEEGRFTLPVLAEGTVVLQISSVGFQTKTVKVSAQTEMNIILEEDIAGLSDVVVVGYSAQKKKDITGSVSVVDVKALNSIPTGSVAKALQGQVPGVTVISSGVPGGESNIFIRGVTSFGNTQPLVLVDGVQSRLDDINMNDIASMQVLKDAGAASIYGVRGSNGVI
ncbi:MAG: TonB-dependent receptor plug domain-containing protein, partial [Chitinophagaceae bacterium]